LSGEEKSIDVGIASDEAMKLLIYGNCWGTWWDNHDEKMVRRPPRFTKKDGV
jgi:hypothetical protein